MVAIPTVLYFGDEQISGGPAGGARAILGSAGSFYGALTTFDLGTGWGIYRHNWRFNKVVPSGADGVTGGTFQPYWDGQAAAWVQFHPVPTGHVNSLLATAYGDNWYEGSTASINNGAVTPCAMLMHSLWARWPTNFRVVKSAFSAGFTGAGGFKSTGSAYTGVLTNVTNAAAALGGGDSLDVKAIIIDCSSTDLANYVTAVATYSADATSFITSIRASLEALAGVTCAATTPIIMVNHSQEMLRVTTSPAWGARVLRAANQAIANANANVYLFDMNWATDWQSDGVLQTQTPSIVNTAGVEETDKRWYSPETYLQAGVRLGTTLNGILAGAPPVAPGTALPVVVMIGDSQFVGQIDPMLAYLTDQESLLGTIPGTTQRDYQYVWNATTNTVENYDVMANSNTFGTPSLTNFGPDCTMLKRMAAEFPGGVALFKYAKNGATLTTEASNSLAVEAAGPVWTDLENEWKLFKAQCLSQLGRSPDCIGIVTDIGSNDEGSLAGYTAFATKAGPWVDDLRALFGTRATGGALPVVWLQPPPHIDGGGNSGHNTLAGANSVRATIAALPSQYENLAVILNTGDDKYELKKSETTNRTHYGGEANLQIGYDLADALIPLIGAAAGSPGAGAGGGVDAGIDIPSENAPFVVETGTGSATANSYCSEAAATAYHETYGNPDQWIAATPFDHQDALRQATRALDIRYGSWWSGVRAGSTQALDWPRAYVYDAAGYPVPTSTIPTRLQQATAILALLHIQGEDIMPSTQTGADIKSETLSSASGASKSVTYIGGKRAETQFPIIDRMLMSAGLTSGGAGWGWLDL